MKKTFILTISLIFSVTGIAQNYRGYNIEAFTKLEAKRAFVLDMDTFYATTQLSGIDTTLVSLLYLNGQLATKEPANVNIQQHITNDADLVIGNELQNLSYSKTGNNVTVNISNGTGTTFSVADADSSVSNEIQDLSLSGNTLSLSGDATTVDLSAYVNQDISQYQQDSDTTTFDGTKYDDRFGIAAYGWGNHAGLYLPLHGKADDSDLLDGISNEVFARQKSSNGTYYDSLTDLNTEHISNDYGVHAYTINSNIHAPTTSTYWHVLDFAFDSGAWHKQLAFDFFSDKVYFRRENGIDDWQSWNELYHSGNSNSSSFNWSVADATTQYHAVNLGQLNTKQNTLTNPVTANLSTFTANKLIKATGTGDEVMETVAITELSNGNVGIGTTSPTAKLYVKGGGTVTSLTDWNTLAGLMVETANPAVRLGIGYVAADIPAIQSFDFTNASINLSINSMGGNVGIGTTSPTAKLDVKGGGTVTSLTDWNTLAGLMVETANPAVRLGIGYVAADIPAIQSFDFTNASKNLSINSMGGNVGIGYSTGTEITNNKLAVNGTGYFANNVTIPDATTQYHAVNLGQLNTAINGTTGYIPKFTGSNIIGNSRLYEGTYMMAYGDNITSAYSDWNGSGVFGVNGTDKVMIGYLTSTTNGAIIAGHNTALGAWAPLNISGTELYFNYNGENRAFTINSSGLATFNFDVTIPAEAYSSAFDGVQEAVTKDAVYDALTDITNGYAFTGLLSYNSAQTFTSDRQIVDKAYVDAIGAGNSPKLPVDVATTGNITLSGTQTIDSYAVTAGQRVLVKDQSTASQNGVYIVAAGAWSRATDLDAWAELYKAYVAVLNGGQSGTSFVSTIASTGTLNTDPITWVMYTAQTNITVSTPLLKTGNNIELTYDSNTLAVASNALKVKDNVFQPLSSVLTATTAPYTDADSTKLSGIATGAEVNVNADWNAISGDAQILNKPTIGTMAAAATSDYYTKTNLQTSGAAAVHWDNITNEPTFLTGNQTITLSGDVTGSGTTSITTTVGDNTHNHNSTTAPGTYTSLTSMGGLGSTGSDLYLSNINTSGTAPLLTDYMWASPSSSTTVKGFTLQTLKDLIATSYTLPLAANGTRGGIQIGYTETASNRAVQLSSEKAYVTLPDATTAAKGVASFNSSNFSVSSGAVSIATGGIGAMSLANAVISGQVDIGADIVDTDEFLISDGGTLRKTAASRLKTYIGTGLTDGDKGDITVSGSGTTLTIDNDAITEAKLKAVNTPTDEYYLTYETTTGDFEWQQSNSGGWTDAGTWVHPTTNTDKVVIGSSSNLGSNEKLFVNGKTTLYGGQLYIVNNSGSQAAITMASLSSATVGTVAAGEAMIYSDVNDSDKLKTVINSGTFDLTNLNEPLRTISSTGTTALLATDKIVLVSGGGATITYPTVTAGKVYTIRNTSSSAITVPSYTVFGPSASTSVAAYQSITVVYNGSIWYQIN